jgi:hypothetical protein
MDEATPTASDLPGILATALRMALPSKTSPKQLVLGFAAALAQRSGFPLPVIMAALVPLAVAFGGNKE